MNNFICFDLEGPLSPQDNAYELMKSFPNGNKVFEVISRYDDLLTLADKPDYEPGDTLALIVPFLILHGIREVDIINLAAKATFIQGALELVHQLFAASWKVFCITTTYEQYALHLTHKLGIYAHNVACTTFPLDKIRMNLSKEDIELLRQTEAEIINLSPVADDDKIKKILDTFFWEKLPGTDLGQMIQAVKPVGGGRKLAALQKFADKYSQPLSQWAVVGDSITDNRMLEAVEKAGGLTIAFNASEFALPSATMGLASTSILDLFEILKIWKTGKRKDIEKVVREKERFSGKDNHGYFHWLSGRKDLGAVIEIHKKIRRLVREEAGKLG